MHILERTWAQVDLGALRRNFTAFPSPVPVMAVVKADAYGHGAPQVARALQAAGAAWFGVSNLDEAVQLREAGITGRILILGYTPAAEAARLAQYDITQTVVGREHAAALSGAGVPLTVHLKVDTGMARLGFEWRDTDGLLWAATLPNLHAEGIFTHFARADEESDFTQVQFGRFMGTVDELERRGRTFTVRHCCNSAAALRFPAMHLDLVRIGIALYGLSPVPFGEPVMTLLTTVSQVRQVPAGTPVSYGGEFVTERETTLATVPIGYADGYVRRLSGAPMRLKDGRARVVGRVCMDQCVLDVTGLPAAVGDRVIVFGRDPTALDLAEYAGTIGYEMACLIGKRVPRVYEGTTE